MQNKFEGAQSARINKKEGDLYKVITVGGRSFEIYYGYYEEMDRQNPSVEPMEIYPDFLKSPVYTDEGIPFAVAMQTPCEHFLGVADEDNTCYQCGYYEGQEELLGLCRCKMRAKK
jgi:hypothetical protein